MLSRLERLDNGVAELREFVAQLRPYFDTWRAVCDEDDLMLVQCRSTELDEMKNGLDLIASLIEGRRYRANVMPAVLGKTRKNADKIAAENAAIWSLAEGVLRVTGKAHWQQVTRLAKVILQIPALSQHRVRHAVHERDKCAIVPRKSIANLIRQRQL